ncbi:hypothetical protein D9758_008449 [Tetrapyrgos nigripes]|uniref:CxC5 like cysteine cluster associated with KDZ domain-containing protein n=1 Tax=Tetrapyrgos nigripes TaxID=182062 RepID=A0A8H5CQS3_9AGAR|nr:hypothetical protein D9758_008449 [Tetrapyrgos nigripes]
MQPVPKNIAGLLLVESLYLCSLGNVCVQTNVTESALCKHPTCHFFCSTLMAQCLGQALSALQDATTCLSFDFSLILSFVRLCCLAKPTLQLDRRTVSSPPDSLSSRVVKIISACLDASEDVVNELWNALKVVVWQHGPIAASEEEIRLFNVHALQWDTSYRHLYPPVHTCQVSTCRHHILNSEREFNLCEPSTYKATLFTLKDGVLPIYTTSLYCRGCYSRYYPNYRVHKGSSTRTYYGSVPEVLQVSRDFFIESAVLELFCNQKVFGWLSAGNCSRIYDWSLATSRQYIKNNPLAFPGAALLPFSQVPDTWPVSARLRPEDVLNGFFLYSLLLHKAERSAVLILPHDEKSHRMRLRDELALRNKLMEGVGQEQYLHACDLCFKVYEDENGVQRKLQAAVCDGITIGHPCCAVHDCQVPLASHADRFCSVHMMSIGKKCAVVDCNVDHDKGFQTCNEHRPLEESYYIRGQAFFQLKARLKKAGVAVPDNSVSLEAQVTHEEEECEGKSEMGNRKLKALFGQCHTHNEQLAMRTCGVVMSRATFFGSEAVSGVNGFLKATFPTPQSTPEFLIFDNNCQLMKHQAAIGDTHFKDTAQPVDVFHFRSKHKQSDDFCQAFCNPAAFPEMRTSDGKWTFNTSICEQTIVWLGGYIAVLRNMEVTRYNFYLDEMIKRRNRYVIHELERKEHKPWTVPAELVFPL